MPKLILSMDGLVLKEVELTKERTTIGRRPHNDIVIDNLAVSGEHAVLITILNDSFIEDLGSTNGTTVNGQPIKKHFLQGNDTVELGKYKLKFVPDVKPQGSDYQAVSVRGDDASRSSFTSRTMSASVLTPTVPTSGPSESQVTSRSRSRVDASSQRAPAASGPSRGASQAAPAAAN